MAPTRPLVEKLSPLLEIVGVRMREAWGGRDARECAARMTRAAATLSGGIELG